MRERNLIGVSAVRNQKMSAEGGHNILQKNLAFPSPQAGKTVLNKESYLNRSIRFTKKPTKIISTALSTIGNQTFAIGKPAAFSLRFIP